MQPRPATVALVLALAATACESPPERRARRVVPWPPAPAAEPSPAPLAPEPAPTTSAALTPSEKARAAQLETLFETGRAPEAAKFLAGKDAEGVPLMPRDPGSSGLDGEELVGRRLPVTRFVGSRGEVVDLDDLRGKRSVVLVILRGFSGAVCLSCTGQTLAINQSLDAFAAKDASVFFVYPGPRDGVPRFLEAVSDLRGARESLPVELLLDVDLRVVREFKIEGKLAKPTTIVLDRSGIVRFAHVGRTNTDRPTVPALLDVLARLASESR